MDKKLVERDKTIRSEKLLSSRSDNDLETNERQMRRPTILEGISQDKKHTELAAQLGVSRWVIKKDLRFMENNGDHELKDARKSQEKIRARKRLVNTEKHSREQNEKFLLMTGMTLKEKTFRNMIDFYKPELLKVIDSKDHYAAITNLPKSVRRTLIKNGIITSGRHNSEITPRALNYLAL